MDEYPIKWITDGLAVGYAPHAEEDLRSIHAAGVRAIVNLCAECYDLNEAESRFGFYVYCLPIVDEAAPSQADFERLIDWMDRQIQQKNKLLVHCRYGIGRTGTVALSFLIHCGYPFEMAREMLKRTPSWPATRTQEEFVDRFIERAKKMPAVGHFSGTRSKTGRTFFERWNALLKWYR